MSNDSDTFTLRAARKLESRLQAYIDKGVDPHVYFNMHAEDAGIDAYNKAVNDFQESIFVMNRAIKLRGEIRRKIQVANEESGINNLISSRETLLRTLSFFMRLQSSTSRQKTTVMTDSIIKGKIGTALQNAASNMYGGVGDDVISFSTITPDVFENIEKTVASTKNTIAGLDETLLQKNVNTTISLAPFDVEFLRDLNVV